MVPPTTLFFHHPFGIFKIINSKTTGSMKVKVSHTYWQGFKPWFKLISTVQCWVFSQLSITLLPPSFSVVVSAVRERVRIKVWTLELYWMLMRKTISKWPSNWCWIDCKNNIINVQVQPVANIIITNLINYKTTQK